MSLSCVCVRSCDFLGSGVKGIYPRHILAGDQVAIDIDCDLNASVPSISGRKRERRRPGSESELKAHSGVFFKEWWMRNIHSSSSSYLNVYEIPSSAPEVVVV